jgi:hypothetical protein
MSTKDSIAACLMVPTKLIDDLCDEYCVDFGEEDVFEMLNNCAGDCFHKHSFRNFGSMLIRHVLFEIADSTQTCSMRISLTSTSMDVTQLSSMMV